MYIGKDGTLVEARKYIVSGLLEGDIKIAWVIKKDEDNEFIMPDKDFQEQYGEAMVLGEEEPHIKDFACSQHGCIPYIPEQGEQTIELDTYHEKEVICPWCGYKHIDSWEMDTGEYDCSECEKPYFVEREVEVYYSTSKVEEKTNERND